MTRTRQLAFALLSGLALAGPGRAQEPKLGNEWYEDPLSYGFKVKIPKDWELTPPQKDEPNVIAVFSAPNNFYLDLGDVGLPIEMALVRFDRRADHKESKTVKVGEQAIEFEVPGAKDLQAWVKDVHFGVNWRFDAQKYPKPLKVKGIDEARYWVYEADLRDSKGGAKVSAYVAEYTLGPDVKIGFFGCGPGDKKWRDYESIWSKLAGSFARIPLQEVTVDPAAAMGSPRAKKKAELERTVATQKGWRLLQTENYFVVTNDDDEDFLKELTVRLEAIRTVYQEQYPPEKARAIAQRKRTEPEGPKEGQPPTAPSPGEAEVPEKEKEQLETSAKLDPLERSRLSVLRVCKDWETYAKYGGEPGSAGFWNWVDEELVIYDDKKDGGRNDTWITLNHEAFHQYIFYFYGQLSPHSWYNEGTGDFFSGYQLKHNRFVLGPSPWREITAQQLLRDGPADPKEKKGYAPLKDFVTWSQAQYYGDNSLEVSRGRCYAQGWSLIYFLRTGEKNKAKGWRPEWGKILDTYLETLATTGDLDESVDKAFHGVDWAELEKSWKDYILSV